MYGGLLISATLKENPLIQVECLGISISYYFCCWRICSIQDLLW
jgi:hypothetical protein